jgi:NitT/TauT family transport system substrate-binding protein
VRQVPRSLLRACLSAALCNLLLLVSPALHAQTRLMLSVPGPGNLLFLPIDLAKKIGADRAEGVDLELRYFGGGPQAYKDMLDKNSDFSAGGIAALAAQRVAGYPMVSIVALSRVPGYTLMVRSDLKGKVRRIADLKGRVVGVKGRTEGGRSTSELFTEYILARNGMDPASVSFLPAGQSYRDQHAALASGAVDAVMGDQPFAARLKKERVVFFLADFHDLATTRRLLGGLFLNVQIATRADVIAGRPAMAEKMVKVIRRSLTWIDGHTAAQIVDALAPADPAERDALLVSLGRYKSMYSPDGSFSDEQVRITEKFFHDVSGEDRASRSLAFRTLIDARWAGRSR